MDLFDEKASKGRKIKRVKSGNSKSGNQSGSSGKKPNELVLKVASNIKGNNSDNSIDYITRNQHEHEPEQFINPENEMGEVLDLKELEQLKSEWKEEFSDPKKINTRNMTHLVLSVDIKDNEKNRAAFHNATRDFLDERFGQEGFRYIFVQHNDTDKPHIHIMVNNNNLETGKKLRIDVDWHYESRLMAKEYLKNYGIEQSATFKKDRDIVKQKEQDFIKRDIEVKNWLDAKLKSASHNNRHFHHLQDQFSVIQALKSNKQESERFTTQEQIELNQKLKNLKSDIALYERFSSRTEANQAVAKMIKEVEPKQTVATKVVQAAMKQQEEKRQSNDKKYQRQLYFHAKELVKAQAIVETTQTNSKEKRATLAAIKERKAYLVEQGIDVKKLEQDHRADLSSNDKFKMAYRTMNKFVAQTDKRLKKEGSLDVADTQKRLNRALEAVNSAKQNQLSPDEVKTLESLTAKTIVDLEARGFAAKKHIDHWREARTFKDEVSQVKKDIDQGHDFAQAQKRLFDLKSRLDNAPPKQLGKKERFAMGMSLKRSQEALDKTTGFEFATHLTKAERLTKSFDTLDKKAPKEAKRQTFAMSAAFVELTKAAEQSPVPAQRAALAEKLTAIETKFDERNIDLRGNMQALAASNNVYHRIKQLESLSMNRVRANGYDKTQSSIDTVKRDLDESTLTQREKQGLSRSLKDKQKEINAARKADVLTLSERIKKIEQLDKRIKEMREPKLIQSLSALERLNNQRSIETAQKELGGLIKEARKLIGTPDKGQQVLFTKTINAIERQHNTQSISRNR